MFTIISNFIEYMFWPFINETNCIDSIKSVISEIRNKHNIWTDLFYIRKKVNKYFINILDDAEKWWRISYYLRTFFNNFLSLWEIYSPMEVYKISEKPLVPFLYSFLEVNWTQEKRWALHSFLQFKDSHLLSKSYMCNFFHLYVIQKK